MSYIYLNLDDAFYVHSFCSDTDITASPPAYTLDATRITFIFPPILSFAGTTEPFCNYTAHCSVF